MIWKDDPQEFVRENEMHKILWYFQMQTYHLNQAKRPDLELINKKNQFAVSWILPFWQTTQWQ